jgi:hypothetical protein
MESSPPVAPRYFIRITPRLPWILAAVATALLLIHVSLQVYHFRFETISLQDVFDKKEHISWLFRDLFDVDQENNIPTWYSHATLLTASMLLLAVANAKRRERAPYAGHWLGLSIVFAFLALDEDAGIHETLNTLADHMAGTADRNYWEIGGLVFVSIFALMYLKFWLKLPPRTRLLFGIAGAGYVFGAVGVEHLSFGLDHDALPYTLMTVWEEGFEMYFIVVFVYAILDYMRMPDGAARTIDVAIGQGREVGGP